MEGEWWGREVGGFLNGLLLGGHPIIIYKSALQQSQLFSLFVKLQAGQIAIKRFPNLKYYSYKIKFE